MSPIARPSSSFAASAEGWKSDDWIPGGRPAVARRPLSRGRRAVIIHQSAVAIAMISGLIACVVSSGRSGLLGCFGITVAPEQARVDEGVSFLRDVARAQRDYRREHGRYADQMGKLNLCQLPPVYFSLGTMRVNSDAGSTPSWQLTLRREQIYSGTDAYTLVFSESGFHHKRSSVPPEFLGDILARPGAKTRLASHR